MLWQYDKLRDKCARVSVTTAANENGFYSDDVEAKLTQVIENPANRVIDKLRVAQPIDDNELAVLAVYIATMVKRVPAHRQKATRLLPGCLAETLTEVKQLISRAGAEGVLSPEAETARLAEADAIGAEFKEETPLQVLEKIRTPWPGREMTELIYFMAWRFFTTKGPSFFITSDTPAFFFECYGLKDDEAELVFPISSDLALHGCWQPLRRGEKLIRLLPQKLVKEFNRRIANAATRFVFYCQKQTWIRDIAQKKDPYLSRIIW
jgi:hypothetical protein